jgi:LuxR family maltose regulon positive regulatory protein
MVTDVVNRASHAGRVTVSVDDPILASKITAPGVPDWAVLRPRITELIAQGTRWRPLTVVTGPPGAGKTMAVASWSAAEPGPVAWVSLDDYDNRPGVFWSYVVAALRRCGVVMPGRSPTAARSADHLFLLQLASALAAQTPPVTLVLDDLHLLTDAEVLGGLHYLLRNVGSGLRLVVCSRMDPPLRLHRYRLAGELAEIRARDLAFSTAETGLLMGRQGVTLSRDSIKSLTRRTEGWAAGIRLAAISMSAHPDPDYFLEELIAEDSPLTGYLVAEVLNIQPPEVREFLLSTSILARVSAESACELVGHERAAEILLSVARANAFVQPIGGGWYCYHRLFAEVLRLKLRCEHPDRVPLLHRRAARWYERNGPLNEAVRHAAEAGDWQLAASMVVDGLAIAEVIQPRGSRSLAGEFCKMPRSEARTEPQAHLVVAAASLSAGRHESCAAALNIAEGILGDVPADQETASRLAAAEIRLAASRRTGNLAAAKAAAARVEALADRMPGDKLARHPDIRARMVAARGAVELWSGHLDEAARVLASGSVAATAPGGEYEQADCLGHLLLAEALRGRLCRAENLATHATAALEADEQRPLVGRPSPAALVGLAWVDLERNELLKAHSRLKQADAALGVSPDKLVGAVACLTAACSDLAVGRAAAAAQMVTRARSGWSVPVWLEQKLSLVESRAYVAAGDIPAAVAAAERAGSDTSVEAAVTLAYAWTAAGDPHQARRALAPALAGLGEAPEPVRVQAWLVEARLSYASGDRARGQRSLASALRLAEHEQLRLPFVLERHWIGLALQRDPGLADAYRHLITSHMRHDQFPDPPGAPDQPQSPVIEPLTKRECEVLQHFSGMLNTPEVADEMCISVNTVKTHMKSICRKLTATHYREAVRRARQLELI